MAERAFSLDEAHDAREAFVSGATSLVLPVVAIDGRAVGDGRPGPVSLQIKHAYWKRHTEGWHRTPVRPLPTEPWEGDEFPHAVSGRDRLLEL